MMFGCCIQCRRRASLASRTVAASCPKSSIRDMRLASTNQTSQKKCVWNCQALVRNRRARKEERSMHEHEQKSRMKNAVCVVCASRLHSPKYSTHGDKFGLALLNFGSLADLARSPPFKRLCKLLCFSA